MDEIKISHSTISTWEWIAKSRACFHDWNVESGIDPFTELKWMIERCTKCHSVRNGYVNAEGKEVWTQICRDVTVKKFKHCGGFQ
jgi:cytochrome c2